MCNNSVPLLSNTSILVYIQFKFLLTFTPALPQQPCPPDCRALLFCVHLLQLNCSFYYSFSYLPFLVWVFCILFLLLSRSLISSLSKGAMSFLMLTFWYTPSSCSLNFLAACNISLTWAVEARVALMSLVAWGSFVLPSLIIWLACVLTFKLPQMSSSWFVSCCILSLGSVFSLSGTLKMRTFNFLSSL